MQSSGRRADGHHGRKPRRQPIVPREPGHNRKSIVSGAVIERLPVNDVREALRLEPGRRRERQLERPRDSRAAGRVKPRSFVDGRAGAQQPDGSDELAARRQTRSKKASVTTGAVAPSFGEAQSGVFRVSFNEVRRPAAIRAAPCRFLDRFRSAICGATWGQHRFEGQLRAVRSPATSTFFPRRQRLTGKTRAVRAPGSTAAVISSSIGTSSGRCTVRERRRHRRASAGRLRQIRSATRSTSRSPALLCSTAVICGKLTDGQTRR